MKHLLRLLALTAAPVLALVSCIDSREEIWIHPSGSGHALITVSLPTSAITLRGGPDAVSTWIDKLLSVHPSITAVDKNIITEDNRTIMAVSLHFDSILDLSSTMAKSATDSKIPAPVRYIMGRIVIQQDGLGFTGERIVDASKAIPGAGFLASSAKDHQLLTIIHLPFTPTEHNATRVENKGRTLIWDIPLSAALRTPHIQRIRVRAPATLVATITIATAIVLFSATLFWRKRKRLRTAENLAAPP